MWVRSSQAFSTVARFYFNEIEMSLPFFFHTDLAQYCITDVPGLNLDTCFQDTHLETGANEIRERIAAWERMDVQLAADEISLCYQSHDYQHRVNSYPQATLALFSPLLRRLCVLLIACFVPNHSNFHS